MRENCKIYAVFKFIKVFFMLKQLFLSLVLLFPFSAMALDEINALSADKLGVLNKVIDGLGIKNPSSAVKQKILDQFEHGFKDDWHAYWVDSTSLNAAKFKNDKVKLLELTLTNKDRVNVISFTYFPAVGQVFVASKEIVELSSAATVDLVKKKKSEVEFEVSNEKDNYAVLKKKGSADYKIYHVDAPNGLVVHTGYGVIDL
jgi:hypothetical protein